MLKKKYLKTKSKVTFVLPEAIASETESAYLVGDFNNWDESATPMEKKVSKNGVSFEITLDLELNQEYQFRYLINGTTWHNDWHADRYSPNPFSGDNSVVLSYPPSAN